MRTTHEAAVLATLDLNVGYGATPVVADIKLTLSAGEVVCLVGPNGAGKSTIIKTIARELAPLAGTIYLSGQDLSEMSVGEVALRRSCLLTERVKTEWLCVRDIVEMGRIPHTGRLGTLSAQDAKAVEEALDLVGIRDIADTDFGELSDGQRQRVLLARAIAQEPNLLLLDEPCSYLDIKHRIDLVRIMRRLAGERGCAILASMHELPLACAVADQVLCVKDGRIVCAGAAPEVLTDEVVSEVFDLETGSFDPQTGAIRLTHLRRGDAHAQA